MTLSARLLAGRYFPRPAGEIPLGDMLNQIFFLPLSDNEDFPIHGPNVIRFVEALVEGKPDSAPGLIAGSSVSETHDAYINQYNEIMRAIDIDLGANKATEEKHRAIELLKVAALYHDIGKFIRRANHPQIGSNLLRNFNGEQTRKLVDLLVYPGEPADTSAKYNRFSLIGSIIQHHDKFGVVCTGEGGLPIFSDILYFTSDERTIRGIKKNITSVMLMNLADIAAVTTASREVKKNALALARRVHNVRVHKTRGGKNEKALLNELTTICGAPGSCLGIGPRKVHQVLTDWRILVDSIEHETVQGNRVQMKVRLLELERNPARAIQRILRLLEESSETTGAGVLLTHITPTSVESVLVGTLGAHQFQTFCDQFATVAKLDYGLKFFQSVLCACVRKGLNENYSIEQDVGVDGVRTREPNRLGQDEAQALMSLDTGDRSRVVELASKITTLFVRVLEGLVSRYAGVLNYVMPNPRRFGMQMRDLTGDAKIRDTIIDLLCIKEHKDPIALTWIVDEVTLWSMD